MGEAIHHPQRPGKQGNPDGRLLLTERCPAGILIRGIKAIVTGTPCIAQGTSARR